MMRDHIHRVFDSISDIRRYVLVCALVMLLGGAIGFAVSSPATGVAESPNQDGGATQPPTEGSDATQPPDLGFIELLLTNSSVAAFLILGSVTFGLLTVLVLAFNGFVLGSLAATAVANGEFGIFVILLFTHGFLELPALIIAGAVGLRVAVAGYQHLRGGREDLLTSAELRDIQSLVIAIVVMLFCAAIIESQITAHLARWLAT